MILWVALLWWNPLFSSTPPVRCKSPFSPLGLVGGISLFCYCSQFGVILNRCRSRIGFNSVPVFRSKHCLKKKETMSLRIAYPLSYIRLTRILMNWLDWPRSGLVQTVAFFGDRLKRLDRTVQHLRTAVRSQKYWIRPFSPVFLSLENGDQ